MVHNGQDMIAILRFELKFLEDGGYGRSPHAPWCPSFAFTDSPTCLNFDDPKQPHPCRKCSLIQFVPEGRRQDPTPCWSIPIGASGETVEDFYCTGTRLELEEALRTWLTKEIQRIECETSAEDSGSLRVGSPTSAA